MTPHSQSPSSLMSPSRAAPAITGHRMLRQIGAGGYGEVWLAQNDTGVYRAVKVVYRSKFQEERPYIREFAGIKRFEPISREHVGLVDVLQVVRMESEGFFYYVMELADDASAAEENSTEEGRSSTEISNGKIEAAIRSTGALRKVEAAFNPESYIPKTLASVLRMRVQSGNGDAYKRLPASKCIDIASRLAAALAYMHDQGIVHRDIKPSNIVFVQGEPKLADPGLAAAADEELSFVGTEGFVAPEGPGSAQADIYALGKVLYQMVTGLSPKEEDPNLAAHEKYPSLPTDWLTSADREELNELRHIFLRACEGDQRRRYATARDMCSDLELLKSGKSLALRKLQLRLERMKWAMAGTVVIVALAVAASLFFRREALLQGRLRDLALNQLFLLSLRESGWFAPDWKRLKHAGSVSLDDQVSSQLPMLLSGYDARTVIVITNSTSSITVDERGQALVGGVGPSNALRFEANGAVSALSVTGDGPLFMGTGGYPVQWTVISNHLVMRNAFTGDTLRSVALSAPISKAAGGRSLIALSPDAAVVAAGMTDRLDLWNNATGELVGAVHIHSSALALSPDRKLLAVGTATGRAKVFSVPEMTEVADFGAATRGSPVQALVFSRDYFVAYDQQEKTNAWLLTVGDRARRNYHV
jgi:serine/threonine protein kinase